MLSASSNRTIAIVCLALVVAWAHTASAQAPRPAYAPARLPSYERRPGIPEVIRPAGSNGTAEPSRQPRVEQLLRELSHSRAQLRSLATAPGPAPDQATRTSGGEWPTIKQIDALLDNSKMDRQLHTVRLEKLLAHLEAMIIVEPTGLSDGRSPQAGRSPQDGSTAAQAVVPGGAAAAADGERVDATGAAVDRLRLADSLFGSDKFLLARDIYLELRDLPSHAGDRVWIEFQIASCYRHLDDTSNAQKFYRYVVGSNADSIWPEYARWWLAAIQEKQDVKRSLEQISQSILETGQWKNDN